jgi:adenylate cyclase
LPSEIRQVIENSHLFSGLEPGLMDDIAASAAKRTLGAGELLFQKGDRADALWGVLSGRVVIEVRADDGKEMVLDVFEAGDIFGEVGVLDFGPRRVDATVACKSELFRLERAHFLEHLHTSPELCFRVFSLLCSHLRDTTETLEDTALYKLPNRLAKRLTLMADEAASENGHAVLKVAQSELARMLGVQRESVNRQLREWEKSGWISIRRERIEILEQKRLADLAAPGQIADHNHWSNENLSSLAPVAFPAHNVLETSPDLPERRFASILAVDCAGYAGMLMTDSANTIRRLKAGLAATDRAVKDHGGRVIWSTGDRTLAEFPDSPAAVDAALEIQRNAGEAGPDTSGVADPIFRIGIHCGEVLASDGRFIGDPVNIAIRLTELPHSVGICVTGEVRHALDETVNLELQYLGKHELKDVASPVSVFAARSVPWLKRIALRAESLVPRRYRPALALGAVLLAVAIIWQSGEQFGVSHAPAPGPSAQSIAVMSFTLEGDPGNAYLANGLAEEIRIALAAMPETLVIGRKSSDYFADWNATGQEIGEILRVAFVLQGTVGMTGDQLKVSSRLVETGNGTEIWHHNYQGSWQEFNNFQADIVRLAGETLSGGAAGGHAGTVALPNTDNQKAYVLYLQARELINEKTRASLVGALAKLEKALELEPDFASAHVAIAETYLYLTWYADYYKVNFQQESQALAQPHVDKALALDANLAEAYVIQGELFESDEKAESAYRKAISLNPNLARAHLKLGVALGNQLRSWNEYLPYLEKALEIEPLWIEAASILVEFLQYIPDRRDEALAIIAYLKARRPDHPSVNQLEAFWLQLEGRPSEAVPLLEKVLFLDPGALWAQFQLNSAWFSLGETERALESPDWQRQWRFVLSPDREESLRQMMKIDEDPEISNVIFPGLSAYIYVMLREWQSAVDVLAEDSQDLDRFRKHYAGNFAKRYSPAVSLAVAYQALGDNEQYEKFAELEKEALNIRSENGRIHNFEYSRTMARLYALEGRPFDAMLELERLITSGPNDPRELMHPAFDEIRDLPDFRELQDLQRQRVNLEREKLGLAEISGGDSRQLVRKAE